MDQNWMNNTTVIVTGASGGMGKGIAESLSLIMVAQLSVSLAARKK